jgi:ribosomal protein S12 methylthiotransferase accessory factor
MIINNYERNEFGKTAHPSDTLSFLRDGLRKLELQEVTKTLKSCENLWSVNLEIPELRAMANGKGTSEMTAMTSAYAEVVERLSAGMETGIKIGEYRQLHGELGNLLSQISLYKYMEGYKWSHQDSVQNAVQAESFLKDYKFAPAQYDYLKYSSELLRHWVPGYSLVQDKEVYVPILFVKWISSTNGIAAGNTLEEAIIQGACEIFERDALIKTLRFMNKLPCPNIDDTSIENETIQNILKYFRDNDIEVVIKDIGQGIYPVHAIITFNKSLTSKHVGYNVIKAGSSFNATESLTRCFTERMQGTHFDFEASQGMIPAEPNPDKYLPLFFKGICPLDLRKYTRADTIKFDPKFINGTGVEIDQCIQIAKNLGTDLIFINHTHPVFNFPVVRVVMPGISDFIRWWNPKQATLNLIGNLEPAEQRYEEKLKSVLRSFEYGSSDTGKSAQNQSRRDT